MVSSARRCSRPAPSPENQGVNTMSRVYLAGMAAALITALTIPAAQAQQPTPPAQPQRPQIETKKVDDTDNVYIFRNGNHQPRFIDTHDGVIATDPVAYGRPTGGQQYVDEIRKSPTSRSSI